MLFELRKIIPLACLLLVVGCATQTTSPSSAATTCTMPKVAEFAPLSEENARILVADTFDAKMVFTRASTTNGNCYFEFIKTAFNEVVVYMSRHGAVASAPVPYLRNELADPSVAEQLAPFGVKSNDGDFRTVGDFAYVVPKSAHASCFVGYGFIERGPPNAQEIIAVACTQDILPDDLEQTMLRLLSHLRFPGGATLRLETSAQSPVATTGAVQRLEELKDLHDKRLITDQDYDTRRKAILDGL
jgi:hypothetical protein